MFDFFDDDMKGYWTWKIARFSQILWAMKSVLPELEREVSALAFKSTAQTNQLYKNYSHLSESGPSSLDEALEWEKMLCRDYWDVMAYIATNSIPADSIEKEVLLKDVDLSARACFRKDITREEIKISRLAKINDTYAKTTVEDIGRDCNSMEELANLLSDSVTEEWLELKSFMRKTDEVYHYSSSPEVWAMLHGESGIALVRNDFVIGKVTIMCN